MQLDEFESRFNRAAKEVFEYREVEYKRIFVISDMPEEKAEGFRLGLKKTLTGISDVAEWKEIGEGDFDHARTLLEEIDAFKADLIITYRNLRYRDHDQDYTLGIYVDVLTQATMVPVLLVPYPDEAGFRDGVTNLNNVLVVSDHIQGDSHLIDSALPFVGIEGSLTLAHIEDKVVYDRYMDEIGKIPAIPTDEAKTEILKHLLKEPADFIESARQVLNAEDMFPDLKIRSEVKLGRCLDECKRLVKEQDVGLIVANTKDSEQLAMHGEAYAIAIEMKRVPLLLL